MKKNIYSIILAAFLGGACLTANTQQRNSMPTPNSPGDPFVAPTPYVVMPPTTEQVDEVVKDAVEKLGISKTRLTTLAEQPSEIVASIAPFEGEKYNPNNLKWAKNIRIVVGERDLNHDGTPERIIVELTDTSGSQTTPTTSFFGLRKQKWECLTCPILIYPSENPEFVPVGKGKYDTIRFRSEPTDVLFLEDTLSISELKKWKEYITDTEMVNGRYKFNKCRLVSGKKEKIVPCPE